LLTGASSGWHPPKSQRFIRRVTFRKNDPVALACIDYGYSVVPSQSDKDEEGRLLNDPFDTRCTEWLVEIPYSVSWANIPGCDDVDIASITAAAQFDFYMQVQHYYTTHNTSATIEYRENEIEELSDLIYNAIDTDGGYISAALLSRFDGGGAFPRLPFEPISDVEFYQLQSEVQRRQTNTDFFDALKSHDTDEMFEAGPAPCDSDKCLIEGADGIPKPFSSDSMFAPV
jgi:ribonucleotide reductase class II